MNPLKLLFNSKYLYTGDKQVYSFFRMAWFLSTKKIVMTEKTEIIFKINHKTTDKNKWTNKKK